MHTNNRFCPLSYHCLDGIDRNILTIQINIGKNTVIALAQALGVAPAYLFGLTENPLEGIEDDEAVRATEAPAAFAGNRFLAVFFSLPAADQELLITLAEKLQRADTRKDAA